MSILLIAVLLIAGAQRPVAELPALLLPPDEGAWVVRIVTTGGFTGRGAGSFTASSAGDMLCVSVASCPPRLGPEVQQSLARLVTAIGLGTPAPRTSPLHPGTCSDCVTTTMTVRRRERDGERTFTYTWDLSTSSLVPEEALRLHSAIITLADMRTR